MLCFFRKILLFLREGKRRRRPYRKNDFCNTVYIRREMCYSIFCKGEPKPFLCLRTSRRGDACSAVLRSDDTFKIRRPLPCKAERQTRAGSAHKPGKSADQKGLDDLRKRLGSLPLLAFFYPAVDIAVKARLNEIHDVLFVDVFVRFSFLRPLFDEGSVQLVCDLLWPARGDAALEYAHTVELEVVFL